VHLPLEPLLLLLELPALAADLFEAAPAGFEAGVLGAEQSGDKQYGQDGKAERRNDRKTSPARSVWPSVRRSGFACFRPP
jgi:hypothetical protein